MKILFFLILLVSFSESRRLLQSSLTGIPLYYPCEPSNNITQQCICTAGNQILNYQITVTDFSNSQNECAAKCYNSIRCSYFTWYSPSFNRAPLANRCILMTGISYNDAYTSSQGCSQISNGPFQNYKASSFYFLSRANSNPPYTRV